MATCTPVTTVRRVTRWFAMSEELDVRPEDALQVAQRALQKCNELEDRTADLEERIDECEG